MRAYLESIILEQINRAEELKKKIHYPLKYPELSGLAERCTLILDEQINILRELKRELQSRENCDIRDIFREVRLCIWEISLLEYYGIPPLYLQTPDIGFLNKLMFKIHQEIKLPFPPPTVSCTSGEYYYSHPFTNVIFVPLAEPEFLLHMPDLYHEVGHHVIENMKSELRLQPIKQNYLLAFSKVTEYYSRILVNKRRDYAPPDILMAIQRIHSQWKDWIEEFFCDLFALYTLGPAYAWSHLHLTTKKSNDIYELHILQKQTHPSDESRMRILMHALRNLGFAREADEIQSRWFQVALFWGNNTVAEYQYAFPDEVLGEIAELVLDAMRVAGFSLASSEILSRNGQETEIRIVLNRAWQKFWQLQGHEFREWEKSCIQSMRDS